MAARAVAGGDIRRGYSPPPRNSERKGAIMRLNISKAIAALALISVAALIAVSLLADVRGASAQVEERRVSLEECNRDFALEGIGFCIEENNPADYAVGKVVIETSGGSALTEGYDIREDGSQNPPRGGVDANNDGDYTDAGDTAQVPLFAIDAASGVLTIAVANALDYEDKDTYILVVEAGPAPGQSYKTIGVVTVNVTDVNEPPFFVRHDIDRMTAENRADYCGRGMSEFRLTNPSIIRINENAAIGSAIADYDACDPEGDNLSFLLRNSSDSAYFDIHSRTGQLSVDRSLDYELKSAYTIEVEVWDSEFVHRITQRIRLNDIAEPVTPTPTRTAATPTPTRTPRAAATPTPTTTPARVSQDVLRRVGALEQLLATLQTLIQSLQGVIAAQDSRITAQDDKIAAQDGRIAALESQLAAAATITPTPSPTATPSPTPTATPEPTAAAASACVQAIGPGAVSGRWTSACLTANPTHGNTYYARFYTFTLDAAADVTIALTSDKPPYLYLLAGAGTAGEVLRQAGGNDQTSVAITDALQAGSYTIEASTWQPKTLGDFTLTLTARQ